MGWLGKVSTHTEFRITSFNTTEMFAKSALESVFGLSNVLDSTDFASNAVDKVGTSTANVFHGWEFLMGDIGFDGPGFVEEWAIAAPPSVAE